jgi:hypothetical protein
MKHDEGAFTLSGWLRQCRVRYRNLPHLRHVHSRSLIRRTRLDSRSDKNLAGARTGTFYSYGRSRCPTKYMY